MKIRNVGFSSFTQFIGSLLQNRSYGDSILKITRCIYCFSPKVFSHICFIDHGSGHLLECPILPFYNSILLWSSRAGEIMGYSIRVKKFLKNFIFKFPTMITSDSDDFRVKFVLHFGTEASEYRVRLTLVLQEFYPCPTTKIINNN